PLNDVSVDGAGQLWVAGGNMNIAPLVATDGTIAKNTAVPGGQSGGFPWGLAIDHSGHVWVSNTDLDGPVAELDATGALVGNYNDNSFTGALTGLVIDAQGNVW